MGSKIITVDPLSVAAEIMEQLPKGAFLTVKSRHHLNVMTIGWGTVGVMWSRPVFAAPVRSSRYTFKLIEQAPDFTVCVPFTDTYREELAFCGTHSGKDTDKLAECKLGTTAAKHTDTPLLDIPGIHFECKTLLRAIMSPDLMHPELQSVYAKQDYHTFYYGEIVACTRRK
jgi:flavin reductase (DIM6/NTAB) family NADH-FMN oxidoreductase RutF